MSTDLGTLAPELLPILETPDASAQLITCLKEKYSKAPYQVWELSAHYLLQRVPSRAHEALAVFWALYEQMLLDQTATNRIHKGAPLVFISDCFLQLGYPVHAKRYVMLALCEDALQEKGEIDPERHGVYPLVWQHGHTDAEVRQYARDAYGFAQKMPAEACLFPEAILQKLEDDWLIEVPSPSEASGYRISTHYGRYLLDRLGDKTGSALETLAAYLMSCMAGCRIRQRMRSDSTDYDLVCAMEGFEIDFRSEFGRYFVCECKDWSNPASFTVMAKFCRVLDSVKARFGILFSKNGISGAGQTAYADREQLKIFQDRGIVIVVLSAADLEKVLSGFNLITLLRKQYETVRLDLKQYETVRRKRRRRVKRVE